MTEPTICRACQNQGGCTSCYGMTRLQLEDEAERNGDDARDVEWPCPQCGGGNKCLDCGKAPTA